jgi:hypothetical protein
MGAYRELFYGVCFYASAVIGGFLGLEMLTPAVRGEDYESQMREDVTAIIVGVIAGCACWLWAKYSWLENPA